MAFLNFDYLIVSRHCLAMDDLATTVRFFHERGIRKFIFTLDFDRTFHPISWEIDRLKEFKLRLKNIRPYATSFYIATNLQMTEGAVWDPEIHRLCVGRSDRLFLQLPCMIDADWIHADFNHLLFKKKLRPIFTSFEANLRTNPESLLDRCLASSFFQYCLDLNYLASPEGVDFIRKALKEDLAILPSISKYSGDYAGVDAAFLWLREQLGDEQYFQLFRKVHSSCQQLFSLI